MLAVPLYTMKGKLTGEIEIEPEALGGRVRCSRASSGRWLITDIPRNASRFATRSAMLIGFRGSPITLRLVAEVRVPTVTAT